MSYKINDNCIGCTICAKNCPVDAINGTLKEKHTVIEKRCIECGVCGNVCPKAAIENATGSVVEKTPKTEWKKPKVDEVKCSACGMCVDVCSFDCLGISYPKFQGDFNVHAEMLNEKKCVACSMCEKICPLKAITMTGGL